jgi:hypothetical protein
MRLTGNRCRCSGCGEYFNSTYIFDLHRMGDWQDRGANRRCLSPDQMAAKGYSKNAAGFWISEGMPTSRQGKRATDEIYKNQWQSEAST